ncbi:hypothetical protein QJS04_geneDACA018280 [Acorus gramineus]|uniref:Uncharacterized protein n=1 Tax=Acorus gramineus TaxID=55184 RepID=A0AAV9B948_ACOGR|nr:hypothetical protein QJS04_geneDACA018280 [Acorus gramineus]
MSPSWANNIKRDGGSHRFTMGGQSRIEVATIIVNTEQWRFTVYNILKNINNRKASKDNHTFI